jgi:hypothetical protein
MSVTVSPSANVARPVPELRNGAVGVQLMPASDDVTVPSPSLPTETLVSMENDAPLMAALGTPVLARDGPVPLCR